jgi:hypothetical protein
MRGPIRKGWAIPLHDACGLDELAQVLYVVGDPNHNLRGMAAFTPPCDSDPAGDPAACLDLLDVQVYS